MTRRLALIAVLLAAVSLRAPAQVVRGVVLDRATRAPLPGALISVIDARGIAIARTTAGGSGAFVLSHTTATTGLRVLRIGYTPETIALPSSARDTTVEITLARIPPILDAVRVSGQALCPGGADRGAAFQLWEQVRAGLLASTVARDAGTVTATTLLVHRRLAPNDESMRSEQQETHEGSTTKPFAAAADAPTLARAGFMREDSTGRVFFGPDEDVLLDESFAATHCFRPQPADAGHAGQLGLAFEPAPGRDTLVDVGGTIWLDAAPLELRSLDFVYVGLEPAASRARPGGHLDFHTTTSGVAFATAWALRVPVLAARAGATPTILLPRTGTGRRARTDKLLSEIDVIDAEVLEARWRDGTVIHADPTGLTGAIARSDGTPAPFALVFLDGKADTIVADGRGSYLAAPLLPGRYRVTVRDTALAAFVDPREAVQTVDVQHGRLTPLAIRLSGNAHPAAAACRGAPSTGAASLFGRLGLPASDGARPRVRASWVQGDSTVTDRYADVDDRGNLRLCGVTLGAPVTLHLRLGAHEADTVVTLNESAVMSFLWRPTLRIAASGATLRTIRGIVVDSANRPVRDVNVSAREHGTVTTNDAGRFRFQLSSSTPVAFDIRRLGFTPVLYSLGAGEDTTITIILLPAAQTLAGVDVTATRSQPAAVLADFEERASRRRGATTSGTFIMQDEIERRHPDRMTSLFLELPGMRVPKDGPDERVYGLARAYKYGSLCVPTIYIDGIRLPDADINHNLTPDQVRGVEVYSSANAAPPNYQAFNGGCAVILVWTKHE